MQRIFVAIFSLSLLLGTTLVTAGGAYAADPVTGRSLNLITSPLPIDLTTKPGTSVSTDLRIKQADGVPETLQVSLLKFGAYGDEGKPQLLDRGPGDTYFDWVTFDKTHFVAQSDVWQTVHMTINVPKDAANGYYYAVTFTRVGDAIRQAGSTNSVAGGTSILVLLNANVPNQQRSLALSSFTTDHRFYEFLPANFNIKFHNSGNIHLVPAGDIFITKGNSSLATLEYNNEQGNILPNSNRIYTTAWTNGWPHYEQSLKDGHVATDSKGKDVYHLVYNNGSTDKSLIPHLRFGKYTAHLLAVYDNGSRDVPIESTLTFWVIPWRYIAAILVLALFIGFGIWGLGRGAWRGINRLKRRKGSRRR
jgi:hypothetical protein